MKIAPIHLKIFLTSYKNQVQPASSYEAFIAAILKAGKDCIHSTGYYLISLLNVDSKIFLTAILLGRLQKILLAIIHPAQYDFMKECQASDNIRPLVDIIVLYADRQESIVNFVGCRNGF